MKKFQRILSVILSVFIMAIIPLNSFAAKIVDSIDLAVNVEIGMKLENYEEYITINTPGVTINEDFNVFIVEIYEEEMYSPSSNCFEPGRVYEIAVVLDVSDGYVFAERESDFESVTVNGEEVYFEEYLADGFMETDYYVVYTTVKTNNTITEIDLTVNPATDYMIDDYYRYVHINTLGVKFEEALDYGVKVTDAWGGDPFDYFVDEEYILEIGLTPGVGCVFAKDDEGNIQLENVTVNGESTEYTAYIENNRGYIEYIVIKINIIPEVKTAITVVDITIAEDIKGYNVEDYESYITIETQGVTFDSYNPYAVYAYDSDYEEVYTFSGGERYRIGMNFIAEEGYFFAPEGIVIIINGEEYDYDGYYTYESEEGITVEYVSTEYLTDFSGNFFDRIVAWFGNIFEFLFGWISF